MSVGSHLKIMVLCVYEGYGVGEDMCKGCGVVMLSVSEGHGVVGWFYLKIMVL